MASSAGGEMMANLDRENIISEESVGGTLLGNFKWEN